MGRQSVSMPRAVSGLVDRITTPDVATRIATSLGQVSGSPMMTAAKRATRTGSVLIQAVVTAKDRACIVTSISAVAPIWASAPKAV